MMLQASSFLRNLHEHQRQLSGIGRRLCQRSGTWGHHPWCIKRHHPWHIKRHPWWYRGEDILKFVKAAQKGVSSVFLKQPIIHSWTPCWKSTLHETNVSTVLSGEDGHMAGAERFKGESWTLSQKSTSQRFRKGCCRQVGKDHQVRSEPRWEPGWDHHENIMEDFLGEQNLNTGQFVSQPGCSIVFLPTAVAKHGGCEPGKGWHCIELLMRLTWCQTPWWWCWKTPPPCHKVDFSQIVASDWQLSPQVTLSGAWVEAKFFFLAGNLNWLPPTCSAACSTSHPPSCCNPRRCQSKLETFFCEKHLPWNLGK